MANFTQSESIVTVVSTLQGLELQSHDSYGTIKFVPSNQEEYIAYTLTIQNGQFVCLDSGGYNIMFQPSIIFEGQNTWTQTNEFNEVTTFNSETYFNANINLNAFSLTWINCGYFSIKKDDNEESPNVIGIITGSNSYPTISINSYDSNEILPTASLNISAENGAYIGGRNSSINIDENGVLILGNIGTDKSSTGSSLGTVTKKLPIYDANGVLLGYIPIYNTIT